MHLLPLLSRQFPSLFVQLNHTTVVVLTIAVVVVVVVVIVVVVEHAPS